VKFTKNCSKQIQQLAVLEPYKNKALKVEKPYFSTTCTSRNPIKKCLTQTPLHKNELRKEKT